MIHRLRDLLGIEPGGSSHHEKLISGLGAGLAILSVYLISARVIGDAAAIWVVGSMGASAVLLFAVPHGALSQPWPVFGGHGISAGIGVSAALLVQDPALAAALAVGVAVSAMYYLRCIHPPGGATALVAVLGGPEMRALGYDYLWTPVLLNALVILGFAVLFNAFFPWRRYPSALARLPTPPATPPRPAPPAIAHEDFVYALSEMDSFIDVTEEDLLRIYQLATANHLSAETQPDDRSPASPRQ